jgi:hypothetical protein|nr:MAG TPA: hypothetical protein [Caudoviricetes sp.]
MKESSRRSDQGHRYGVPALKQASHQFTAFADGWLHIPSKFSGYFHPYTWLLQNLESGA